MSAAIISPLLSRALRKLELLLDEGLASSHDLKEIGKILATLQTMAFGGEYVKRQAPAPAIGTEEVWNWLKPLQIEFYAVDDVIDAIDLMKNPQTRNSCHLEISNYPPLDKISEHLDKLSSLVVGTEYCNGFREYFLQLDAQNKIPTHLKLPIECFLLQETCKLGVDQLTQVWMGLGFLFSNDAAHSPEFIARKYLKEVINASVDPVVEYAPGAVVRHIKREDALSESTAPVGDTSWVVAQVKSKSYGSPTYMVWDQECSGLSRNCVSERNAVRLFMVSPKQRASEEFVAAVVSCFPRLRVLGVGGCDLETLPEHVGGLFHLRYLDAGRNPRMKSLPDAIGNLILLQTLCLEGCSNLQSLPREIWRLRKLRYLTATILDESLPEAIGYLTSLRTLGLTGCRNLSSLPSTIKDLKNLKTFAIVDCPALDLAAGSTYEAFKGLSGMHTLLLSKLPKFAGFPSVLGSKNLALAHLQILECSALKETTWITQFTSLRSLTIGVCSELQDLKLADDGSQLGGLLELVIQRCPKLHRMTSIEQCVSLRSIVIYGCMKLLELDAGFAELKNLVRLEIGPHNGCRRWLFSAAGKAWQKNVHDCTLVSKVLV